MKPTEAQMVAQIRARLEKEPRVNLHRWPIALTFDRDVLVVGGEVGSLAAKKRTLEIVADTLGAAEFVDQLRVEPSQRLPDGELLERVVSVLSEEAALRPCELRVRRRNRVEGLRSGLVEPRGDILVSVADGVVTLDGQVSSLTLKRLAECLMWWVPATRDVVNGLEVSPPEEDSDEEITEALHMVLQKDPLLRGLTIGVTTEGRVVTLVGVVNSESQRRAAEDDGWCLFGVDQVISKLQLRAG